MTEHPFGLQIERGDFHARSLIGEIDTTPAGNIALRVGRENAGAVQHAAHPSGWHQTEHIVLTPNEARRFADAILAALPPDDARDELERRAAARARNEREHAAEDRRDRR